MDNRIKASTIMKTLNNFVKLINDHFNSLFNEREFSLPKELKINNVYKTKGGDDRHAPIIFFFISENNKYCDYLLKTDSYTSHQRIKENGAIEPLENYDGQFGWPILGTKGETEIEHNRIKQHNQYVQEVLIRKGFITNSFSKK